MSERIQNDLERVTPERVKEHLETKDDATLEALINGTASSGDAITLETGWTVAEQQEIARQIRAEREVWEALEAEDDKVLELFINNPDQSDITIKIGLDIEKQQMIARQILTERKEKAA